MAMEDHLDVSKLDHQRYGLAALKTYHLCGVFFWGGCFSSIYLEKYVCIYCIYNHVIIYVNIYNIYIRIYIYCMYEDVAVSLFRGKIS